jgi:hemerythrin-like domain-containing protein
MESPAVFGVAPLTHALLADPIAFLAAEHTRQMALIGHLERLAKAPAARGARVMAGVLLRWLTEELPVHIADEERSLYPRLSPHDASGTVARLSAGHRRDAGLVATCLPGLRALYAGERAQEGFQTSAAELARLHRQQLELEDRIVMPLARAVIAGKALRALATEMAARRGLVENGTCPTEA